MSRAIRNEFLSVRSGKPSNDTAIKHADNAAADIWGRCLRNTFNFWSFAFRSMVYRFGGYVQPARMLQNLSQVGCMMYAACKWEWFDGYAHGAMLICTKCVQSYGACAELHAHTCAQYLSINIWLCSRCNCGFTFDSGTRTHAYLYMQCAWYPLITCRCESQLLQQHFSKLTWWELQNHPSRKIFRYTCRHESWELETSW